MIQLRRLILLAFALVFLLDVARFHSPKTGFSSFIQIGDKMGASTVLSPAPHYVYENSWGYDGQAYVQLAVNPLLGDERLKETVDNLPYRARRIGMPWLSWLFGAGQPYWVIQAYSLMNVAAWLLIGLLLLHWLPPLDWQNVLRWLGFMFSIGLMNSVHCALTDGPSMALLLLGLYWLDTGRRGGALLALGGSILCRETMLLGVGASLADWPPGGLRGLLRSAGRFTLCLLPFGLWMIALFWLTRGVPSQDASNFAIPFSGYLGRWAELWGEFRQRNSFTDFLLLSTLSQLALTVQLGFFLLRWRPSNLWWRLGLSSCLLLLFLGKPVWEGHPGAALRVLLPMSLAFNLLLPRGRRWLLLLVLGNLGVLAGWRELANTPAEDVRWEGPREQLNQIQLHLGDGWYSPERSRMEIWCWAREHNVFELVNTGSTPLQIRFSGRLTVIGPRTITLNTANAAPWSSGALMGRNNPFATGTYTLPPGRTQFSFDTDQPGVTGMNGDPRTLAFSVRDLTIEVLP